MTAPRWFPSFFATVLTLASSWLLFGLLGSSPQLAYAATRTVCREGLPTCDYATVQEAVDAAAEGDVIKVAAGVYNDLHARPSPLGYEGVVSVTQGMYLEPVPPVITQVVYIDKSITLRGGYTTTNGFADPPDPIANPTVLDAQGQGRVLYITGPVSPTVEGFSVTGGNATDPTSRNAGGGIYVYESAATLSNNRVYSNTAGWGGGAFLVYDYVTLQGNTISSNTAELGGGLFFYKDAATVRDNVISGNTATREGGGVYLNSHEAVVSGNTISGNEASMNGGGLFLYNGNSPLSGNLISANGAEQHGGGLFLEGSDAEIRDNVISGNVAPEGGGLYLDRSDAILQGNLIVDNAADRGGGLTLGYRSGSTLNNNIILRNQATERGAGLFVWEGASIHLAYSTIHDNTGADGSGLCVRGNSSVWLTDTVLVSQTVGLTVSADSRATVAGVLWFANGANVSGNGAVTVSQAITGNPALAPDGYHLTAGSPAVDAGVYSAVFEDVDHQFRPMKWGYDLGADEYPGVGLRVSKAVQWASPVPPNPGEAFTYTIDITATGSGDASGVVVTDTLPVEQRALSAQASTGPCLVAGAWGGTVVCSPGDIVSGTTVLITISAEFSVTAQPGVAVTNTAEVRSAEAANAAWASTYSQDCHVRLNDDPTEYTYVQAAVDAAAPGDLVKVAGTCVGVLESGGRRQQAFITKTLTLQGGYSPDFTWDPQLYTTTLDARGQGRVLYGSGPITLTIEALNVTGGNAYNGFGGGGGGGDFSQVTLILRNCRIYRNIANMGGGLHLDSSDVTMSGNLIAENEAGEEGGGLRLSRSTAWLDGNTFSENRVSLYGGGLSLYESQVILTGNSIVNNVATAADKAEGGGLTLSGSSSAVLTDNTISGNRSGGGGGMTIGEWATAALNDNFIVGNTAIYSGGGLYVEGTLNLVGNRVSDNQAGGYGGGLLKVGGKIDGPATIQGNLFSNNRAMYGGGLALDSRDARLNYNTIVSNTADYGGGVVQTSGYAVLNGNDIQMNVAITQGGGIRIVQGDTTLDNNVIANNQSAGGGGGVDLLDSHVIMRHNTVVQNGSVGIEVRRLWGNRTVAMTDTILMSHTIGLSVTGGVTVTLEATLWGNQTDWVGEGTIITGTINLWGDPAFVDPPAGDYHLSPSSAALDQGIPTGIGNDIDGEPRPYRLPDLGADEYWPAGIVRIYLPLVRRGL